MPLFVSKSLACNSSPFVIDLLDALDEESWFRFINGRLVCNLKIESENLWPAACELFISRKSKNTLVSSCVCQAPFIWNRLRERVASLRKKRYIFFTRLVGAVFVCPNSNHVFSSKPRRVLFFFCTNDQAFQLLVQDAYLASNPMGLLRSLLYGSLRKFQVDQDERLNL